MRSEPNELMAKWGFWYWEYQRRNEKYIKDYDNYSEYIKNNPPNELWAPLKIGKMNFALKVPSNHLGINKKFLINHGRLPKDYRGTQIDDFIEDMNNSCFTPEIDDVADLNLYKLMLEDFGSRIISRPFSLDENPNIKLEIDVTKPMEQIKYEIDYLYYYSKAWTNPNKVIFENSIDKLSDDPEIESELKDQLKKSFFNLMHYYHKKPGRKLKGSDSARAMGIWVWDFVKKHHSGVEDAIVAYYKKYDQEQYQKRLKHEQGKARLKMRYEITEKCIKTLTLLPMTK